MAEESQESPPPAEGEQDEPRQATSASTNIEELQERSAQEGRQAVTEDALREVLRLLDPHPQDAKLSYAQVLGRLENVIARELQQAGD